MGKDAIYLKVGGLEFNLEGVASFTFDKFVDTYRGNPLITSSLKSMWETLRTECKKRGIKWTEDEIKKAPANKKLKYQKDTKTEKKKEKEDEIPSSSAVSEEN